MLFKWGIVHYQQHGEHSEGVIGTNSSSIQLVCFLILLNKAWVIVNNELYFFYMHMLAKRN